MPREYKDKPFIFRWFSKHNNRRYINRFDTREAAEARFNQLKQYGIIRIEWLKGK